MFNLEELEDRFSSVFDIRPEPKLKKNATMEVNKNGIHFSQEFYNAVQNHAVLSYDNDEWVMLRAFNECSLEVDDQNSIMLTPIQDFDREMADFSNNLIQHLRFFKSGDVDCVMRFMIEKDKRHVVHKHISRPGKTRGLRRYRIETSDIDIFSFFFKPHFEVSSLCELAVSSFNLSYEIFDPNTRYVTLMTCLESLFNHDRDPISHLISRHLAILISKDSSEFSKCFSRTKKLYGFRSDIVHGRKLKEDIAEITLELENLVRLAINKCRELKISHEDLFSRLNTMGYSQWDNASI